MSARKGKNEKAVLSFLVDSIIDKTYNIIELNRHFYLGRDTKKAETLEEYR